MLRTNGSVGSKGRWEPEKMPSRIKVRGEYRRIECSRSIRRSQQVGGIQGRWGGENQG